MTRILIPKEHEPIRLIETKAGPRYRAVLDTSPKGAPRKQETKTFDSLQEARRFVLETRNRLAKGSYTTPSKVAFRKVADDWLRSKREIRAVSVNGYRCALERAYGRIGDRPVQAISRQELDALVDWLRANGGVNGTGLSQRSIVYTLGTIKQVLDYAVSTGLLSSNPGRDVKPPRRKSGDKKAVTVWEPDDLLRFRKEADANAELWARAAFRLTLCGLRRSEILGLAWDAVDLEAGTVKIAASRVLVGKGKTQRDDPKSAASARTVAIDKIHPGSTALFRALKISQSADRLAVGSAYANADDLVVVDRFGFGVHPDAFTARFHAICKKALVTRIGIHSARHSLALILHRGGVAPADAAALLGHTITTHLTYYVPKTERGAASAASRLGEVFAAAGN